MLVFYREQHLYEIRLQIVDLELIFISVGEVFFSVKKIASDLFSFNCHFHLT